MLGMLAVLDKVIVAPASAVAATEDAPGHEARGLGEEQLLGQRAEVGLKGGADVPPHAPAAGPVVDAGGGADGGEEGCVGDVLALHEAATGHVPQVVGVHGQLAGAHRNASGSMPTTSYRRPPSTLTLAGWSRPRSLRRDSEIRTSRSTAARIGPSSCSGSPPRVMTLPLDTVTCSRSSTARVVRYARSRRSSSICRAASAGSVMTSAIARATASYAEDGWDQPI